MDIFGFLEVRNKRGGAEWFKFLILKSGLLYHVHINFFVHPPMFFKMMILSSVKNLWIIYA